MMKYRVLNTKPYTVYIERFMLYPGENVISATPKEAEIIASSNGSVVTLIDKGIKPVSDYPEIKKTKKKK